MQSFEQIYLLLREYERQYSHSLGKAIEEQFSGTFKRGLLAISKFNIFNLSNCRGCNVSSLHQTNNEEAPSWERGKMRCRE